ncbi:MAG: hypothetical protein N2Z21_07085 [Candidatus Sumerlaeaceae bacterium]|nr:hypothetical protein [Candidatus Sumerlaeaceae bacterium]
MMSEDACEDKQRSDLSLKRFWRQLVAMVLSQKQTTALEGWETLVFSTSLFITTKPARIVTGSHCICSRKKCPVRLAV